MEKMFVSIVEASKKTGLSANYLRKRIHSGTISCIKSGTKYLIHFPKLLELLDAESSQFTH